MTARGIPVLLVAGMVIDALGSGMTAPFILTVGHLLVGLSLPVTGLAAAAGALVGIIGGPLAGAAVDRFGPARTVVAANLICALGNVGLLLAQDAIAFGIASGVCAFAVRAFYAAFAPLVSSLARPEDRETWFGLLRAARNIGLAVGGGLASVAMLAGEHTGLRLILASDAGSYLLAATLITLAARSAMPAWQRPATTTAPTGYAAALADRANAVLALLNVACTVVATTALLAMPVYVLDRFPGALWLPGVLTATVSTVLTLMVAVAPRLSAGRRRLRILAFCATLWAAGGVVLTLAGLIPPVAGIALLLLAAVLLGLAEALYAPTADALPLYLAPPGQAGRYSALHQLAWGVASVAGPLLAGGLSALDPGAVWPVLATVALGTAVAYTALGPRLGHRAGRAGTTENDRVAEPA
ncbi:MFS transporter [Catenuloplanes sp. NPDC051500]|uniref:MFS transporter n=1 Tax=Catenuloplanes sp. NPDC051500 TaxID=3363959 RepID=UPI0037B01F5C